MGGSVPASAMGEPGMLSSSSDSLNDRVASVVSLHELISSITLSTGVIGVPIRFFNI